MTPSSPLLVSRQGGIVSLQFNRPEAMNALIPQANSELEAVFDAFAADPDQWVAIVTGAGDRAFCAGLDLKATAAGEDVRLPPTGFGALTSRFDLTKPVIAAVNGIAMGGGFEIALACDLVVASEKASFALSEPTFGLAAFAGGLHRLARDIGLKRAMSMILTGRRVTAREGLEFGFVNEVVPPEELMAAAMRLAEAICACSPMAIRASKETVMKGLDEASLADALAHQWRYPAARAMFKSEDFREGPRAFAAKRPSVWIGR